MNLEDWRNEIDKIDEQLIELLNRRTQCAIEIGHVKRRMGLPVYSPSRETEVIDHVVERSQGPLEEEAVRRLFERIIDESRRIERIAVEPQTTEQSQAPRATTNSKKKKRQ